MIRRGLPLLVAAAVLALASAWLTREPDTAPRQGAGRGPDYFITGVVASETGMDGQLRQRLVASQFTHYAHTDSAVVERPHLAVYEAGTPWHAYAARGQLEDAGRRVILDGGVRLTREQGATEEIITETLHISPEQHFAETDDPITYRSKDRVIEAVGMEVSLATQRLLLKSKVRGTYAP